MERALNLDLLRAALGQGGMFPPPEEVQRRLAEAEIALFLQRGAVDDELLATAWYLHGVGTARESLQIYPVERQLQANRVAAHIFDLTLSVGIASEVVRREMTFAAQVSYLRGDLDPNAIALYQRLPRSEPRLRDEPGAVSLDVGSAVVALDRRRLFGGRLAALRREARQLARIVGVTDLIATPYGAAARVIEGPVSPHRQPLGRFILSSGIAGVAIGRLPKESAGPGPAVAHDVGPLPILVREGDRLLPTVEQSTCSDPEY
jgi:hypothetical protein